MVYLYIGIEFCWDLLLNFPFIDICFGRLIATCVVVMAVWQRFGSVMG